MVARRMLVLVAWLGGLGAGGAAEAQEVKRLEPVVVTATRVEEPLERLGSAVTVITEEELQRFRYDSVGEALRRVPGVDIQRSGGPGKTTALRIRGATPQQVQVLVDGVRVKSPTTGLAELADIPLDEIERIEIVRGPQSTIYGADAIGGVVNIITKRGRGPVSGFVSVEGGNYDTHRERAGLSGSLGPFDYALGGSWFETNGQFRNDGNEQRALAGQLGLRLPADGRLSLTARYERNKTELPFDGLTPVPASPFFVLDPNAEQTTETAVVSLAWDQKPVEWFEVHARLGRFWSALVFRDPATPADAAAGNLDLLFGPTRSEIEVERREAELLTAFHAGRWNTLTLGAEHRTEVGRSPGNFRERLETVAAFVQDELRLFDRLILSGGRRWDDHSAFGSVVTHRAGAVVLLPETGTKLRASWGEGFRAPTINDLFFPGFANPGLRPERSESWDAGVDQRFWRDRVRLGVTYFENSFRDLIQLTFNPADCPPGNPFGCPVNVGRARSEGVEVSAEVDLLDTLTFSGTYTFTDTKDLTTGGPLRRFPPHRYTFGLTWTPERALTLFSEVVVVSSQFEREGFPRNPGYHRVDLGGRYRLAERRGAWPALEAFARLNNVTDQSYMEVLGFRALGIHVLAGLEARY
jgi:vitamin B12 transporter